MGQTARDTRKAPQPVRIRLTLDLEGRVNRAWREGPHKDIDRQQFLLVLLRLGIEEYDQEKKRQKSNAPTERRDSSEAAV